MVAPQQESQTLSRSPRKRSKRLHHQQPHHLRSYVSSNPHLPDDVLDIIFSFLPIKHEVQIGVLSKRFRTSWLYNRKLFFDREFGRSRTQGEFIEIVNRVFDSHVGSRIQTLRLHFDLTGVEHMFEKWIKICIKKGIEELDLDFYQRRDPFRLSSEYIDVESIRILKLVHCSVVFPPKLKGLGFLTTLILRRVDLTAEMLETLFCHCLNLETLDLWYCCEIDHFEVFARNLKKFKALKIGHCLEIERIDIDSPTLRSIYYTGNIVNFRFYDAFQLDEVLLYFIPPKSFIQAYVAENLVSDLSHVNVLTTSSPFLEGLTARIRGGTFRATPFCFWNLKEFHLYMEGASYCNLFDIASFLKNCPCLERLFIDLNDFSFECGLYWELHQKEIIDDGFYFSFTRLKIIKIQDFKFQRLELELVKFLLEKTTFLEALVLVTPKNGRARIKAPEAQLYNRLFCSWRASPRARILMYEYPNDRSLVHPKQSKSWV